MAFLVAPAHNLTVDEEVRFVTHRRRSTKLLASLFALSMLAAACGDDDEEPAADGGSTDAGSDTGGEQSADCPEGIYQRDGVCLELTWQTVAGNARREQIQALVIPQLEELGILVTADNTDPGTLFEQRLPQRQTEMMLYANVASPDPSTTGNWGCDSIPTEENEFAGANNQAYCNEEATDLMLQADAAIVDQDERVALTQQVGDLMREDAIGLPFYQLPLIAAYRTDLVTPPEDDFTSTPYSNFGNMYDFDTPAGGGSVVFGAEQWPECLNAITQCASASWLLYSVTGQVLPRLMELNTESEYVPSPVLAGEPELSGEGTDNGDGPFTVTYTIAPEAVWDDGSPMTCADIAFTLETKTASQGVYAATGYDQIASVTPGADPKECAIEFTTPYAAWPDLFGGGLEFFLKAAAFPNGPDISTEMATSIPFSGGPWILQSWSPTESVFVPNTAYWDADRIPLLDQVTFVPQESQETEVNAFLAGEVSAIFPQPAPGLTEQLEGDDITTIFGAGSTFEGLWFDTQSLLNEDSVLYDREVREAIMFGIDRELILEDVILPLSPEAELLNCYAWVPTVGPWCDNTDFEDVTFDPDRVAEILEADGWVRTT